MFLRHSVRKGRSENREEIKSRLNFVVLGTIQFKVLRFLVSCLKI